MLRIKLEKNKKDELIFKLGIKEEDENKYAFIKRALIEGKRLKGRYNYQIPLRYFKPIFSNVEKENIVLDKNSILFFLEFSDAFDEKYYYTVEANAKYMKKWREEGCPNIYKFVLDRDTLVLDKSIAFKKIMPLN